MYASKTANFWKCFQNRNEVHRNDGLNIKGFFLKKTILNETKSDISNTERNERIIHTVSVCFHPEKQTMIVPEETLK